MNSVKFQNDFYNLLQNMKSDDDLIDGVLSSVCELLSSAVVTTSDKGIVPGGSFIGTGSGSISAVSTPGKIILKSACEAMQTMIEGGDDLFATALGNSINAVITSAKVSCNVSGIITPPSPAVPYTGVGVSSGVIVCNPDNLIQAMKNVFKTMNQNGTSESFDGNQFFAQNLTTNLVTMITSGTVTTAGQTNLLGSIGNGTAT